MTILVADVFSEAAQEQLRAAGHTVEYRPKLKGEELTASLSDLQPQVLIVRSTKVTEADLDAGLSLELVVRAGAGVDTIDVEAAAARGIFVANCPGKNASAVAELAFGLILALDRRIPDNVIEARQGRWNKAAFSEAQGVKGRMLGLVGIGSIGQEMIPRAQAFGMRVLAWSRSLTDERAAALGVDRAESPHLLASEADVVSVHVASTPDTHGLIDREFFNAMKPGATLINTSRADVVDEDAMRAAIANKGIRVGTDVPQNEPQAKEGAFSYELADNPSIYITHHIGASTEEATEAIGNEALRVVLQYAESGRAPNTVNLATQTPATHLLTVRHRDKVGVLAAILDVVRRAGWNVQEMENLIFEGARAACARIQFDGQPDEGTLDEIRNVTDVLNATVIPI